MKIKIEKGTARGRICAPASKSATHRLLICAAMCDGVSRISGATMSEDILATIDCLRAFGARIESSGDSLLVTGCDLSSASASEPLCARESGSTLRFLVPLAMLSGNRAHFKGAPRLMERPHGIYEQLSSERGLEFKRENGGITVKGPLTGGDFYLAADVSSQFISGLLFALPTLGEDSRIILTTKPESLSYINLTISAMKSFGVLAEWSDGQAITVKGNQRYSARDMTVEGDWSGAAFMDALNLFGGEVFIDGLLEDSIQGDKVYRNLYSLLGDPSSTISLADFPDLGPILFALAAAKGGARFTDTRRLRIKESDRAAVMREELSKFGARLTVSENEVTVYPATLHAPSEVLKGHNDHRIVMSLAVLGTLYGAEIEGAEAVKKSYPDFFSELLKLGIKCYEI